MARSIVYDGTRLFLGAMTPSPRGIDRVDLMYARFLFAHWPGDCFGLLPTPWGMRSYDRARASRLLDAIERTWRENVEADADPLLGYLRRRLEGNAAPLPRIHDQSRGTARRVGHLFTTTGFAFGTPAARRVPRDAIYLNVGQLGWAAPWTTRWLRRRPDIRGVFMLHDVIPLQHPELVSHSGRVAFRWMLDTVLRRAGGLITTSHAADQSVRATLRRRGHPEVATVALPLPVAPVFLQPGVTRGETSWPRYFVICGAIETRKNHVLLLEVWRRLIRERGAAAPKLLILGSPAHGGAEIQRRLAALPELRSHVTMLSGLSSPALRQIMANAEGVLMPSLAEGFGLPVIEALTVGTPVLASDLPSHREVGLDLACYLDPGQPADWVDAIVRLLDEPDFAAALRRRIASYRPMTGASYFARIGEFLAGMG